MTTRSAQEGTPTILGNLHVPGDYRAASAVLGSLKPHDHCVAPELGCVGPSM